MFAAPAERAWVERWDSAPCDAGNCCAAGRGGPGCISETRAIEPHDASQPIGIISRLPWTVVPRFVDAGLFINECFRLASVKSVGVVIEVAEKEKKTKTNANDTDKK